TAAANGVAGQAVVGYAPPAPNGGPAPTSYTATCVAAGKPVRTGTDAGAPFTPITVAGMTDGGTYACTVKATNAEGVGPSSGGAAVRVGRPGAPARVTNGKGSSTGSIKVTWTTAPAPRAAAVSGYTVRCAAP